MTGTEFVAAARSFVGAPFYPSGRSIHGLDCVGLLLAAAREAGGLTYEPPNYTSSYVDPDRLRGELERFCDQIDWPPIEDGDIGVFSIAGNAQHVAILTAAGTMVHAYQSAGKVVEHPLDHHWSKRLVGVWRLRPPK